MDISPLLDQQLNHSNLIIAIIFSHIITPYGTVEGCVLVLRRQGTQRTKEEAMMMRRKGRRRRGPAEVERESE